MTSEWQSLDLTLDEAIAVAIGFDIDIYRQSSLHQNVSEILETIYEGAKVEYIDSFNVEKEYQVARKYDLDIAASKREFAEMLYIELGSAITKAIRQESSIITLSPNQLASMDFETIRFTGESFWRWAQHNEISIPFDPVIKRDRLPSPPTRLNGTDPIDGYSGELVADTGLNPTGITRNSPTDIAQTELTDSMALLLTWAWMLDVFMELQVTNWKTVLTDANRKTGHDWFRGTRLNSKHVGEAILPGMEPPPVSQRTLHKHIEAAKKAIFNRWTISEGFKPKQLKAAYQSLYGLVKVAVDCWVSPAKPNVVELESPDQAAKFLVAEFPLPSNLPFDKMKAALNKSWG